MELKLSKLVEPALLLDMNNYYWKYHFHPFCLLMLELQIIKIIGIFESR